jgi:hypothetical protein
MPVYTSIEHNLLIKSITVVCSVGYTLPALEHKDRQREGYKRNWREDTERHCILRSKQVPMQYTLVLLTKVWRREGKMLGSKEDKSVRD